MAFRSLDKPIEAVLFDFHLTLVDQGDPQVWLNLAWNHAGRQGSAQESLGQECFEQLAVWINRIWEHVREIDPKSERDLSSLRHREIYDTLMERIPGVDEELSRALYEVMLETWIPYTDTLPTLLELKRLGLKIALISNVGFDVRGVLERGGMAHLFDAVILSYEVGAVKPGSLIFERALEILGIAPGNALMVGDNVQDDGGAALLGIRTLLLPRTQGSEHGLDIVLRMVGDGSIE
jgi:HAD superfamily hydrolase (TIGR01549 family)